MLLLSFLGLRFSSIFLLLLELLSLLAFLALLLFLLALSSLFSLALLLSGSILGLLEQLRVSFLAVLGGIVGFLLFGSGGTFLFTILLIVFLVVFTVVIFFPLLFTLSAFLGLNLFSSTLSGSGGLLGSLLGLLFGAFSLLGRVLRTIDLLVTLGLSGILTLCSLTVLLLLSSFLLGLLSTLLLLLLSFLSTLCLSLSLFGFLGNSSFLLFGFTLLALDGSLLSLLLVLGLLNTSRKLVLPGHDIVPREVALILSQLGDPSFELGVVIAEVDALAADLIFARVSPKLLTVGTDSVVDELLLLSGQLVLILLAKLIKFVVAAIVPLTTIASPATTLAIAAAISTSALAARRTTVATSTASTATVLVATATSRAHLVVVVLVSFGAFLTLSRLVISTTRTTAIITVTILVVSIATAAATVLTSPVVVATSTRRVALGGILSVATASALGSIVLLVRSPLVGVVSRALATFQLVLFGDKILLRLVDV